ncbi:MAG TPA: hypothetical protein VNZ26_11875 [Vicinamibacterales bacterium]|jgi:hypothetical protein|nr:hypothetical protein [Vicinamibacterales bacterium]
MTRSRAGIGIGILWASIALAGCRSGTTEGNKRIEPEYDPKTGKLRLLKYDADGDGRVDTWSYMDGTRVVRIEIDKDEDGKIDRWEYYGEDQKLEKVGFSRLNDGKEDAWSYAGPDGSIDRIEVSTHRDGKVDRIEHYKNDRLVSAEEDTDGDGKIDKWETYDGDRLASVAFDTAHRGTPDRRLTYDLAKGGAAILEMDPNGSGHFTPIANRPNRR